MNNTDNQSIGMHEYLTRLQESKGANKDTDGLGVMIVGSFAIGNVDAISGEGGKEVSEFVATRHELGKLAEYWMFEGIKHDFDFFVYQSSGSSEWRWSVYIDRRLRRLREILGSEAIQSIQKDAIASFRKRYPTITEEDWHVFTEGTEQEQDAWRARVFGQQSQAEGMVSENVTIAKKEYEQFKAQGELLATIIDDERLNDDILIVRYDPDLVTRAGYGPDGELTE